MNRRPLTLDEVSEQTGVPVNTLRYYRQTGRGPRTYRLGRRVVTDQADLDAWLAEQRAADQLTGTGAA